MPAKRAKREKPVPYDDAYQQLVASVVDDSVHGEPLPACYPYYAVQTGLMNTVLASLLRRDPVSVVELPTGCGKTLALLAATRRFQYAVHQLSSGARKALYTDALPSANQSKRPQPNPRSENNRSDEDDDDDDDDDDGDRDGANAEDEGWEMPLKALAPCFPSASTRREPAKKSRLRGGPRGDQHRFPQIFYTTRTHAQVAQVPVELSKLRGVAASSMTMNILAGRDRLCINRNVRGNTALPNEGNNLGEICDKLVAVNQCPAVSNFVGLARDVLLFGCNTSGTKANIGAGGPNTWQIEDLVQEGVHREGCPYYAAREMVYDADLTLCTYNYLFDPVIRAETKFERALRHSIVVVDEAHNIGGVCQDVLTLQFNSSLLRATLLLDIAPVATMPRREAAVLLSQKSKLAVGGRTTSEVLAQLVAEFRPDHHHGNGISQVSSEDESFAMRYNRSFSLPNGWSIGDCMDALIHGGVAIADWADEQRPGAESTAARSIDEFLGAWRRGLHCVVATKRNRESHCSRDSPRLFEEEAVTLFRAVYGLIHCLGVTFNPFDISVFGLAQLKRLLVVIRFSMLHPKSFVYTTTVPPQTSPSFTTEVTLRCLDASIAFSHLANTVSCLVLASGTLSPVSALSSELGFRTAKSEPLSHVTASSLDKLLATSRDVRVQRPTRGALKIRDILVYSGAHVVDLQRQARAMVITKTVSGAAMRCVHTSLSDDGFIRDLAATLLHLLDGMPEGALVLFPNFAVCDRTLQAAEAMQRGASPRTSLHAKVSIKVLVGEPRVSTAFPAVLERFRSAAAGPRGAALFAVHRGKVSEGLNFSDGMARVVINVGVPFRPVVDPLVVAQREWAGQAWYSDDAIRAVNQGLGRCLRHRHDWGAMVLLDERYAEDDNFTSKLSQWIRPMLQVVDNAIDAARQLTAFSRECAPMRAAAVHPPTSPPPPTTPASSVAPKEADASLGRTASQGTLLNPYGMRQSKLTLQKADARLAITCGVAPDPQTIKLEPAKAAVNIFNLGNKPRSATTATASPPPIAIEAPSPVIIIDDD